MPIHNLMEDAATAEISRSQLWQWVRHGARTAEGRMVTADWVAQLLNEETDAFRRCVEGAAGGGGWGRGCKRKLGGWLGL